MSPTPRSVRHAVALVLALVAATATSQAVAATAGSNAPPADDSLDEVVISVPYGLSLRRDRVPGVAQVATSEDIAALQPLDISELLNRGFGSVTINHAQNNPLQPDVNFRGFTASPLLGLPQGLAVYTNGIRANEVFGDTVNWDLIPLSAIDEVQLLAGTNPVFGLNALGGTLSVRLKDGFRYTGTGAELYAGSFARRGASVQHGGNNGTWGWYGNADYFAEDGWRDFSRSEALRVYGGLSRRSESGSLDLSISHGDTSLRGNGASPAELLAIDRTQVFTHPDITENRATQVILEGSRVLSSNLRFAGNAFYRHFDTDTFNGDGTIFDECEFGNDEFLVEEDFDDVDGDGGCNAAFDADIERVLDPAGNPIEAEIDGVELGAINNLGRRRLRSGGVSGQLVHSVSLGGTRRNDLTVGGSYLQGKASFDGVVEVAALNEDRSTTRTGILADEFRTNVDSDVSTYSLYAVDTLDATERLTLTLSGRYDVTRVRLEDRSGQSPELNGSHKFSRFNPAAGATFRFTPALVAYANVSQSSRAPTAVELACAEEDAPCSLPNAFLADPPLDDVVARSVELGLQGEGAAGLRWRAGLFHTRNRNDILFQTVGGAQANVGFFDNVSDTLRKGLELELSMRHGRFDWSLNYSYIDATFEDDFVSNSPNHPLFGDDATPADPGFGRIAGEDKLLVRAGDAIPGLANHVANLAANWQFGDRLRVGADLNYRSGVHLRGDEINVLGRTGAFAVVNLRAEFRVDDTLRVFARVENLFDSDYETFGLLGEPDEIFPTFEDPRFYGAGPPLGIWAGVRLAL
jgi:outer membrane receptor protein involved in Fe transport